MAFESPPRITGIRAGGRAAGVLVLAVAVLGGCSNSPNMRLGRQAETRGRFFSAYEYYCDEAKLRPSSGEVRGSLARVAPRAAKQLTQRADQAVKQGEYADAWRLYMRGLAITPDDPALARLVRMMEKHYPDEIASAKAAWMNQGEVALAVVPDRSPIRQPEVPAPLPEPEPPVVWQEPPPAESAEVIPAAAPESPQPDVPDGVPDVSEGGYLVTVIVSVEDHRFPRREHLVDDIHVGVRDTDEGPDADLDVYVGTRRVRKARDVEPGDTIKVRGRSGRPYELVVITIVDRTESVRVGIRPVQ